MVLLAPLVAAYGQAVFPVNPGDRVYIKPLGTFGTVVRERPDGRITAIGDGATQAAVWLRTEIETPEGVTER